MMKISEAGVTSKIEHRTIRLAAVQDPQDIRINTQVVEWVAEQEVGRTISEAIGERDRGDLDAVRRRLRATIERLTRYGTPGSIEKALRALAEFQAVLENWGARSRKSSRLFASRSRKSSSYYEAKLEDLQSDNEPKQPPQNPPAKPPPSDDSSPGVG